MDYDKTNLPNNYDAGRSHGPEVLDLWMRTIASYVGSERIRRIVDVGCGTGRFTPSLAAHFGAYTIGLDPSSKMLEHARAKPHEGVEYQQGSAEAIPLATGSVDLVFMSMCFHHFRDRDASAVEARRVLREGGILFMRTGTSTRAMDYPTTPFFPRTVPLMQEHLPTVDVIRETFERAGFRTRTVEIVTQVIAPSWTAYADKIATGSDSILARLSPDEFHSGVSAIRAMGDGPAGGIVEPIDVFVFERVRG